MASQREKEILRDANRLREKEHRLRPSLRLKNLAEAKEFVQSRGLVSALGGNELPSMISAFLGREWEPSGKGFTGWLEWWGMKVDGKSLGRTLPQLENDRDIISSRIFRNTKTLISRDLWPVLDPIANHYWDQAFQHKIFSQIEWKVLERIDRHGPIRTDRLRADLDLKGKTNTARLHSSLSKLESYALVVGSEDPRPEKHLHANVWSSWKTKMNQASEKGKLSYVDAVEELFLKTMDSSIIARETDVAKWFQWKDASIEAKTRLLDSGRVLQADNFLVSSRVRS